MSGLEVFERDTVRRGSAPAVTIETSKRLRLNAAAYRALQETTHVVLLFDPDTRRIGLRPCTPDNPIAYKVSALSRTRSRVISSAAFLRHYRIDTSRTRRYVASMEDDMLVVDLNAECRAVIRR